MGSIKHQQACMECTKKCLKTHRKMPTPASNSTPLSFFKIMVGDFREVLFIPPTFDLLDESINHNIYLEDSDGNSSSVKLSVKDGSLVFQEGWREFVLDHSIEVGEFVVFKYVGELSFSVQIFGVSACERVCFHDKNKSSPRKKNRNKTDLSPEEFQLPKRCKNSDDLKDKCHPVNEDSPNKEQESKDDLSDLPDIEFIGSNCAEKDENESEKSPHCLGNSGGTQTEMALGFNKQSCDKIDEVAMSVQEEGCSAPVDGPEAHGVGHKDSLHEQETSTIPSINERDPKAVETDTNSDDAEIAVLSQEKIFHCDDNCRISQTAPTIECAKSMTENQMNSSWDIIIYMPKNDCSKEPGIAEKHPMRNQGLHNIDSIGLADDLNMLEHEKRNLIVKDKDACKFLLTEEGVCHIFDKNLTVEPEANQIIPIIPDVSENNVSVNNNGGCCNEIVHMPREEASSKSKNIPEVSFPECTPDRIKVEKCEGISEGLHGEEGLRSLGNTPLPVSGKEDAPCAGSVGSAPQNLHDMDITEGNTHQAGILPDDVMEEDEENIAPYLKGKTLKAVKAERMGSDDVDELISPKLNSLSFMLSSNAQSWTKLPQTLPYRLGKKRHGMRVVTLQDLSMREWPVLYHESLKFVGFLSGWKDFAVANNLQEGNMCELFEVASEWEPTFRVQISKMRNDFDHSFFPKNAKIDIHKDRRNAHKYASQATGFPSSKPAKPSKQAETMRREGRQHGLVITYGLLPPDINPKPKSRVLNRLDCPPTAGVYTKVSTKPTNHSKFTGRCSKTMWSSCHFRPACNKSKDKAKAKGNRKLKSSAMDSGDKLRFDGVSATRVLDNLYGDNWTIESDGDVEYASNDEGLDEEKHRVSIEESRLRLANDDGMDVDGIRPVMVKEDDVDGDWVFVEECEF